MDACRGVTNQPRLILLTLHVSSFRYLTWKAALLQPGWSTGPDYRPHTVSNLPLETAISSPCPLTNMPKDVA